MSNSNDIKDLGVLISLYTGLRIGEICGLKWSDINFEDELLYVNRTTQRVYMGKTEKTKLIITKPKTQKSRRKIPIGKILLKKLKEYKNYHRLRHSFASQCIAKGMDAKSLSEILGHSNIGITINLYVHSSNEVKKKYINKL